MQDERLNQHGMGIKSANRGAALQCVEKAAEPRSKTTHWRPAEAATHDSDASSESRLLTGLSGSEELHETG